MSQPSRRTVFSHLVAAGAGAVACTAAPAPAAPVPKDKEKAKLPSSFTLQADWRWCKKCEGLFFNGSSNGTCADGKEHDPSDSGQYVLQVAGEGGQSDWRRCKLCEGLFFGADKRRGNCPAGKEHDPADEVYTLSHNGG